jgi:predicted CXXCH cytochrome family protein
MKTYRPLFFTTFMLSLLLNHGTFAQSIIDTKHNLSISGPGPVRALSEEQVCIFCHTPHKARPDIPYLWNRADSTINYIPYQSSTLYASVGQPTGASKLCLSCHDGTIALGALVSESVEIPFIGGIRFIPEGPTKLGSDLSDDHPVSFAFDSTLALNNTELVNPSSLPTEVKLDTDGQLQCTACHDPHIDLNGKFLVLSNAFSNLCKACHQMNGWISSAHSLSGAAWNNAGADPWPYSDYTTVAENGCISCHKSHSAEKHERLLLYAFEEDNCLACHNGNVAGKNIEGELTKLYTHAVQNYTAVHDPAEDFSSGSVPKHVECSDCHNSHYANAAASPGAPQVSGTIDGVTGINSSGQQITVAVNEYEICYKCHADNNVLSVVPIDRQIQQLNTRDEFDSSNPSFHPVETAGVNPNVPSLLSPYTTSSIIFCTDCHNNDSSAGPGGPHGSIYEYLLEENYLTDDNTPESSFNYALCYKCHDRNSILADQSFKSHALHVQDPNIPSTPTPCSACHDAHGISSLQGSSANNSNLINFDITIVQPDSQGRLFFEDLGTFTGQCYLSCHGVSHEPKAY